MKVEYKGQEIEVPESTIQEYVDRFLAHGPMERWRLNKLRDVMHIPFMRAEESPQLLKQAGFKEEFIQAHAMRQAFKKCGIMEFDA